MYSSLSNKEKNNKIHQKKIIKKEKSNDHGAYER